MEFKRPESSIFPQKYQSFTVNGEEFYISDLTEDHTEAALDLLVNYVIPEETFCKGIRIHEKPNAMKIISENYLELFAKKTSLVCCKKESDEIVGLNILGVKTKGEKDDKIVEDPDLKALGESRKYTTKLFNVFNDYKVNHYLHAFGLGVTVEHRGKGIAVELLKARIPLMRTLGLSVTATVFSTLSSQKAAVKAGYKETYSISYDQLRNMLTNFDFSMATGTHCKDFVLQI